MATTSVDNPQSPIPDDGPEPGNARYPTAPAVQPQQAAVEGHGRRRFRRQP